MFYLLYVCPLIMLAHIPDFCRITEQPFIENEDYFWKSIPFLITLTQGTSFRVKIIIVPCINS